MQPLINKMQYRVDVIAADGITVLYSGVPSGVEDLSGKRLEQAQLINNETTHLVSMVFRPNVSESCYILYGGRLFAVDYLLDPGVPLRGMFLQVYAHKVGGGITVLPPVTAGLYMEDGISALVLEDGISQIRLEA